MSWQQACARHVAAGDLDPGCLTVLEAFGRTALAGPAGDFDRVEAALLADATTLPERLVAACATEVDAPQAAMFGRRFSAVLETLGRLAAGEARVLRVGLLQRMAEVVVGPGPRALRVRAVADFYASQAGALQWRGRGGSLDGLLAGLVWQDVAPGVRHGLLAGLGDAGPLHVNLLAIQPDQVRLQVVDLRGEGSIQALSQGAVAAVSGGFFLYSEPDIPPPSRRHDPVGLVLADGRVESPPCFRRGSLLVGPDGVALRPLGMGAVRVAGQPVRWWSRAHGPRSPWAGRAVIGSRVQPGLTRVPPLNGVLLRDPVPDPVPWTLAGPWTQGLAGGPMLLQAGVPVLDRDAEELTGGAPPITFSQDETFDQNLLPRMGVGLREGGELVFAAVDGRNLERALGLTLRQTGDLLARLGCHTALNLDGGSSKRMVIGGRVVDLASTEVVTRQTAGPRVRPVHTAVRVLSR